MLPTMSSPESSPPRPKALILVGLVLGLVVGFLAFRGIPGGDASSGDDSQAAPSRLETPAPIVGAPAPDFSLETTSGETVRLSDLQGQVVLLNFWATWCGPCEVEMPALQSRYEALKDRGLIILGVDNAEPLETVREFGERLGLTFPLLLDPKADVQQLYRVRGYPTTLIVGVDGRIEVLHIGVLTEGQLDNYLQEVGFEL